MDRNLVIATVLISAILLVWLWMLAPPPPTTPGPPGPGAADTLLTEEEPVDPAPAPAPSLNELQAPAVTDSVLAAATEGEARTITVVSDLYEATFSTRGGTITSFQLLDYLKADQSALVQLVDTSGSGAISLVFTSPASHLIDTRAYVFDVDAAADTLRVGEAGASLTFTLGLGEGQIQQTYTFQPETYEVGLEVAQLNPAAFSTVQGYELVWNGGVPFSEGNAEDESNFAGAYARSGGEIEGVLLADEAYEEQRLTGQVDWVAVKDKYFTAVMIPQGETRGAELLGEQVGLREAPDYWEDYAARLIMPSPTTQPDVYTLYLGPMELERVNDYELAIYDMVDLGYDLFEWITRPLARYVFIPFFNFFSTFIPNYGVLIIILAILMKAVLYPLTKKSYKSMAQMRELQPKMEEIKEKYGDNPQKQQEAMMKMYRETGVNPLGGCLPMLLQWPIIIALWQFLPQSIEIRQQGFLWASDLSAPDVILQLPFTIPFYGDFVAGFTLLMGLSMVVQMRVQMASQASNPQTKIFMYVMPVFIFAFFNRFASGLSLYYLCYNIFSAIQQKWINDHIKAEQDEKANGRGAKSDARGGKKASNKKRRGRSSKKVRT